MQLTRFAARASLKDGKLVLKNARFFRAMLARYDDTEKVRVVVERETGSKTNRQLGYLFGVVYPEIAAHTGHTVDELDAIFKAKHLHAKVMWRGGEVTTIRSKADLTSEEMGEYITAIILEAAELGIEVPPPDPGLVARRQTEA
jgi:hypothetical protein